MTVPTPQSSEIGSSEIGSSEIGSSEIELFDIESAVRTAMAALDDLADRPLAEHVEAFERLHAVLGEALADHGVA